MLQKKKRIEINFDVQKFVEAWKAIIEFPVEVSMKEIIELNGDKFYSAS